MIGRFATPISSGGGGTLSYTLKEYDASDTWTKPDGLIGIELIVVGSGGGGSSGSRRATGVASRAGCGGAGGGVLCMYIPASSLSATETITIGAGGAGGTAVTADDTAGVDGTAGGNTSFGSFRVDGGAQGTSTFGGFASLYFYDGAYDKHGYFFVGANGRASSASGTQGQSLANQILAELYVWENSPDGGGINSSNTPSQGGIGTGLYNSSLVLSSQASRGTAGSVSVAGGNGGNGIDNYADVMTVGPLMRALNMFGNLHIGTSAGGGGSGGTISAAGDAGITGKYGIGGAGGGASRNGYTSGAGSAGSGGIVKVLEIKQT
jgi:hypothetical protein